MPYDNNNMRDMGPNNIRQQVCCSGTETETEKSGCTQCDTNSAKNGSARNELLNFKMLRPIDHVLNFVIIFSVVSVAVLIGLLIFKKR
jgi:hypothetical protein